MIIPKFIIINFSDTITTVSKITTLYSRKIEKENSEDGIRKSLKQCDGCAMYMNRVVNDSAEMNKINDTDISDEEISNEGKLIKFGNSMRL